MTERPILFSAPMIRAIVECRKTQTRRVIKPQPHSHPTQVACLVWETSQGQFKSPYGQPGDKLWVKETFLPRLQNTAAIYRADLNEPEASGIGALYGGWKPSIFMPRWASRITLEVVSVKVERVQEISEQAAASEGIQSITPDWKKNPVGVFAVLWDAINANRGFGWDNNPWVWTVEFKLILLLDGLLRPL